jgi:hypothetical protein
LTVTTVVPKEDLVTEVEVEFNVDALESEELDICTIWTTDENGFVGGGLGLRFLTFDESTLEDYIGFFWSDEVDVVVEFVLPEDVGKTDLIEFLAIYSVD